MNKIISTYYASQPATILPPTVINPILANNTTGWYDMDSMNRSSGRLSGWYDKLNLGPTLLKIDDRRYRRRLNPDGSVLIGPNADSRNADVGDGPLEMYEGKLLDAEINDVTMFFVFQTFYFRDNPKWTLTNNSVGGFLSFLQFSSRLYTKPNGADYLTRYHVGVMNGTFGLISYESGGGKVGVYTGRGGRNWVNPTNRFQDKAVLAVRIKKTFKGLNDMTFSFNGVRQQNVFATNSTTLNEPRNAAGFVMGLADGFMVSMYEMAFFNHAVDDTNMVAIEDFLKTKWNIL